LQTSKTDNNALDIDAIYNLKFRKTSPISTNSFTTKSNAKFPWPPIMPKQRECILFFFMSHAKILIKLTEKFAI
jgi:hypothetical protein